MKDFDLDKLPRRMPYHLPEGSLEAIEQEVYRRIAEEESRPSRVARRQRQWWWLALPTLVAASVACFVFLSSEPERATMYSQDEIEQAFEALSEEDKAFILGVYEEDDESMIW